MTSHNLNVKAPHFTSLSRFMWIILELLDRWDQKTTLYKWNWSKRLSPDSFSLFLSLFFFFTWKQKCKNGNDNTASERQFELHSLQQSRTGWTLPAIQLEETKTWHWEEETKPKQNNTKQLRINVKMECKCDYRMQ